MELIAAHPLNEDLIRTHIGKPILGVTRWGDPFCGTIESCRDGSLYLVPLQRGLSQAKVKTLTTKLAKHNKKRSAAKIKSLPKASKQRLQKANISQYGPVGYGVGPGFGFGLGAGIGFALPLLAISALYAWPFFI